MDLLRYILDIYVDRKVLDANPGEVANNLLSFFGQDPIQSTYQCYKRLNEYYEQAGKSIAYKNVHKRVKNLYSLGLIEKIRQNSYSESDYRNNENLGGKHGAIYYKLTPSGLFYVLKNCLFTYSNKIILDHKKNGLFEYYLFPLIDIKTIEDITHEHLLTKIFDYLSECCRTIEILLHSLEGVDKDHGVFNMLGFTDTIVDPKYESDPHFGSRQFLRFLKNRFKIKWLEEGKTKIVEIKKNKIIKICNSKNELVLSIYPAKNKAILREKNCKISEFIVYESSKDSYFIREFIPTTTKDYLHGLFNNANFYFTHEMKDHSFRLCNDLLFYICHDYFISDEERLEKQTDSVNLARDTKFLDLLEELRDQYDSYYDYINHLNKNDLPSM